MIPGELIYVFQNGLFQQLQVEMIFFRQRFVCHDRIWLPPIVYRGLKWMESLSPGFLMVYIESFFIPGSPHEKTTTSIGGIPTRPLLSSKNLLVSKDLFVGTVMIPFHQVWTGPHLSGFIVAIRWFPIQTFPRRGFRGFTSTSGRCACVLTRLYSSIGDHRKWEARILRSG